MNLKVFIDIGKPSQVCFWARDNAATWLEAMQKKNLYSYKNGYDKAHPEGLELCGLTGEVLKPEDGVYLVIANGAFPSRTVSAKRVNEIGFEAAARRLLANYEEALKHQHWFI